MRKTMMASIFCNCKRLAMWVSKVIHRYFTVNPEGQAMSLGLHLSRCYICIKPFCSYRENIRSYKPSGSVRDLRKPLTKHYYAAGTADFCCCFLPWVLGKEKQPSEVLHMLFGSIVTAKKLGWCQKKPHWLFAFYYFLKSNFDLSSPVRKKFTKYTSVGVCVDSSIYLVFDPKGYILLPQVSSPSAFTKGSST